MRIRINLVPNGNCIGEAHNNVLAGNTPGAVSAVASQSSLTGLAFARLTVKPSSFSWLSLNAPTMFGHRWGHLNVHEILCRFNGRSFQFKCHGSISGV